MAWIVTAVIELGSVAIGGFLADAAGIALAETAVSGALIVDASFAVGGLISTAIVSDVLGSVVGGGSAPASVSSATAQGIMLNTSSTVEPLQVIYGNRKVGGTRCLCEVSGPNNEHLNIVIALAEGAVSNLSMIYIDDVPITDPKFSGPDAHFFMASSGQGLTTYRPRLADGTESQAPQLVYAEFHPGHDGAQASAALQAELPLKWTPDHVGGGVAYLYLKCTYDRAAFSSVPTITADMQGKLVGGVFVEETFFSNNPAHCLLDYLTNQRYGRGISGWQIDQASFSAAAAYCDESLTIEVPAVSFGWSGISLPAFNFPVPRYTCDGLINVNNTIFDNVNALLSSCRGMLIYSGGKYKLVLDRPTAVSMDFNETNITGNWTISKPSRRQQFNKVTAGIFNPENNWQPDYAISDDFQDRNLLDNGLMLEAKIDLPFTASIVAGRRLAAMHRKQSRFGTKISFTALPEGMRAEVGDVISITHSTPGWIAKEFRVQQISLASNGEVEITASEYDASVYDVDAQGQYPAPTGNNTPNNFALAAPTGLLVAMEDIAQPDGSLVTRITATWDASLDPFVTGYELQWREDAGAWHSASQAGNLFILPNTTPGHLYILQVRAVNNLGTHSPWATGQSVTFGVPVAIPAFPILNATSELFGISFTWTFGDARKDISYSELVWSPTNERSTAVTLVQVAYPQTHYLQSNLAPGEGGYYWLRVVDKFGNASLYNPYSATQGLRAISSVDPGKLLQMLNSTLGTINLTANLNKRITAINADALLTDIINAERQKNQSQTDLSLARQELTYHTDAGLLSEASARLTLAATVGQNQAALISEQNVRVTQFDALSHSIDTLVVSIGATNALVQNEATARATADTAQAGSIQTVQAQLNTDIAAVQAESSASVNALGVLNARHTLKLDVNGNVSGIESVNSVIAGIPTSSFTVLADKFLVAKPDGSGTPIPMLSLGSVNGVTTLGISGNLVVDGSITGRTLNVNSVTAEKIDGTNLNVVNGTFSGTIAAGSVNFASSVGSNFNYPIAGTYTLTVPTGMTRMRITIQGGGGGGSGGSTRGSGYGGGGAEGAEATTLLTVTPGQTFTLRVGAGGAGGGAMDAPFSYQYASAGQETYINGVIAAGGGAAGVLSNAGGHESGDGWSYYGDKGGGTYGGLGATTFYQSGQAGILAGGGGGGAGTSAIYHTQPQPTNGGNGGAGIAKIEYFDPNGLVLKSSLDALKAELRTQGLTIS